MKMFFRILYSLIPPHHRPRWVPFHVMDLKSNFVRIFAPHPHSGGPKNLAQNGKWRESWTKSDQTHRNRTVEQYAYPYEI